MNNRNDKGPRMNGQITAKQIRLIGADGEMVGVVTVEEGIKAAEAAGLDLIEISPNAEPPVCKVLDYGKFKYEQQKKDSAAKKKQKTVTTKEIKVRPNIEEHDLQVKIKRAKKFLEEGNKVRVSMLFRGRENEHKEIGMRIIHRIKEELELIAKPEMGPKFEGNQALMILAPITQ